MARLPICLIAAIASALLATPAHAQRPASGTQSAHIGPLVTAHPGLEASLHRIGRQSALWRAALEAVRATGRRIVVLTPDQVLVADEPGHRPTDKFDQTVLAETAPQPGHDGRVDVVMVVVNLGLLEENYRHQSLLPSELAADLDRILIHEIYGHAVPYLIAGHLDGRCPDPSPRERASNACSIRRENAVRAELGLGERTDYGLDSLALTRGARR